MDETMSKITIETPNDNGENVYDEIEVPEGYYEIEKDFTNGSFIVIVRTKNVEDLEKHIGYIFKFKDEHSAIRFISILTVGKAEVIYAKGLLSMSTIKEIDVK